MLLFFTISVMIDLHTAVALLMQMIDDLLDIFPTNIHLQSQKALVYYHMRGLSIRRTLAEYVADGVPQISTLRRNALTKFRSRIRTVWKISTSSLTCSM